MIYIKRNKFRHIPGKWDCVNTKLKSHDITNTFGEACICFLRHLGISFKRAIKIMNVKTDIWDGKKT